MASMAPGSNAALTAENPDLQKALVGFGWSLVPSRGPQAELVPLAIMCGSDGRAISDEHLVFFNQLTTPDDGLQFVGSDDVEQIDVDLKKVPELVKKIVFIVYVDPEVRGLGTFAAVRSAYIRVADQESRDLVRFDVPLADQSQVRAMQFGELYRHEGGWKFRAIGQGYLNGLSGVASDYKVTL
ncbi:TerD family protein [Arthrobacter sp. NQ7]|uniref:TerD family protein n=1 Tax=Arthrobacter sp. NQ7 TaxID=3032303 RepID=UPI0024100D2C|nr:TerD family protein [Arthrobacter sp. NQ7]MDJ0457694.1 TerD family protein [Arthrobacter sp. NQ7]